MITSNELLTTPEGEVNLLALWRLTWKRKFLVAGVALSCGVGAAIYALLATPIYSAQVIVTVAEELGTGGLSALANQFGDLASLAGVNLGGSAAGEREARAVLKSRRLIEEFITRNDLRTVMRQDSEPPPSLWQAAKRFQESVLDISEDQRQGIIVVSVEWTDADTAARWANDFVSLTNELIRARAIEESERNIAYLSQQVSQTNVVEVRNVMYNLIEGETKKLMIANGRSEYAFKIIDPAVAPELRSRPRRTAIVMVGAALGFVLGVILAIAIDRRVFVAG